MIPVFEPELWGVSPQIPDGKTPTTYTFAGIFGKANAASAKGDAAASKPAEPPSGGLKLWDGGKFDFHDILDIINPLHHLPVINSIYRSEVKDEIGAVPRILGSMLYGGGVIGALIGAASAIVNIVIEHETGKDLGQHIYTAIFGEGAGTRRTTQVAAPKTGKTGEAGVAAAAKAAAEANPAPNTIAATPGANAASNTIASAPGAKPLTSKADAALQAFVAGLAKRASPAAAAAANAAIAKRSVRVTGTASAAAAIAANTAGSKGGAAAKGDVSTQFRRADWYQHNQAILKAQAAALAKSQAAASSKKSATSGSGSSGAAILQLFMNPSLVPGKSGNSAGAKPAASATPTAVVPTKPTAAKPAAPNRGSVAGPWVANEIANGLAKYEGLVKSRAANANK